MKLLILGSEGFIGRHLISYFNIKGYDVIGCDLFDKPSQSYNYVKIGGQNSDVDFLFTDKTFEACINAGGSGNVSLSMKEPLNDFKSNVLATIRVLDSIRMHAPDCKYLHISSAAVYGNPFELPVKEADLLYPISPYGWHKLMAEKLCEEYSSIFNIRTAAVRPFSVYGPGLRKQIFWDLYQKSISNPGIIELWGTGNESRDFIFIDDLVKIFDLVIQKGKMQGEVYNAGTGTETTIATVAKHFFRNLNVSTEPLFNGKVRMGDPKNWKADISQISKLGFIPTVGVTEGIKRLTGWLKSLS